MYKDGNSISIDKVFEIDTEEPNGLTIEISISRSHLNTFMKEIYRQLQYFENVIIKNSIIDFENTSYLERDFNRVVETFNNIKIKNFKTFKATNIATNSLNEGSIRILVGKVSYPLNKGIDQFRIFNGKGIFNLLVGLKFEIGELDITPNRESILYSERTIKVIYDKLKLLLEEVEAIKEENRNIIFNSVEDIIKFEDLNLKQFYPFGKEGSHIDLRITNLTFNFKGLIYNKTILNSFKRIVNRFELFQSVRLNIENKVLTANGKTFLLLDFIHKDNYSFIVTPEVSELKNNTKKYIRYLKEYGSIGANPIFLREFDEKYFESQILRCIRLSLSYIEKEEYEKEKELVPLLHRELFSYLKNSFKSLLNINNDSVPQSFIEKLKEEKKNETKKEVTSFNHKEFLSIHLCVQSERDNDFNITLASDTVSYEQLEKSHLIYVYTISTDINRERLKCLARIFFNFKNYRFIGVSETKAKRLKDLKNTIEMKDLFINPQKYDIISKIGTAVLINKEIPKLFELRNRNILNYFSNNLDESVLTLYNYVQQFNVFRDSYYKGKDLIISMKEEIYNLCKEHNCWDLDIKAVLENSKIDINNACFLLNFKNCNFNDIYPYLLDYIVSNKIFRVDFDKVDVRKNLFVNKFKKENNENN